MKIGFIGDLILTPEAKHDQSILEKLNATDLNVANLESPFIRPEFKSRHKKGGLFQLMSNCEQLKELNIQVVSLANNHICDFGYEGLKETIRTLEKENIRYFGAGNNEREAAKLIDLNIGNKRIAIGGFVSTYLNPHLAKGNKPGTAALKERQMINQLRQSDADVKLLYNHWNQEFEDFPEPLFQDMGKRLINHCDGIIGGHSHCIQGIQEVKGKYLFHSIGNFTMPHTQYRLKSLGRFPEHCYESFFLILNIASNNKITYDLVPYKIQDDGGYIASMTVDEGKTIRNKLDEISRPLNLGYREYYAFYKKAKRRKFRPVLRKNHARNVINLQITFILLALIRSTSSVFAWLFDRLGIRQFIRRRFSFILNRLFKL